MCVFIFGPSFGFSQTDDGLSETQASIIQRQLDEYYDLNGMRGGDLTALRALRPWVPTIDLLLKELLKRETAATDPVTRKLSADLMAVIHDLAARAEGVRAPNMTESMSMQLDKLLHIHRQPGTVRDLILETIDRFKLWSERELWFFMEIKTPLDVVDNHHRIRQVLPKLDEHYKILIADRLRAIKPMDIATLCVILDTGQLSEKELIALFRLASTQFAKALQRASESDEEFMEHRLGDPRAGLVGAKLKKLMKALSKNDPGVASAFRKAVEQARHSRDTHYAHEDRLLFFTLFLEGRLQWHDRSTWYESALIAAQERIPLRDRFRTDGNVIRVEFGAGKRCEDKLEEN